jgi:hypothetical protein
VIVLSPLPAWLEDFVAVPEEEVREAEVEKQDIFVDMRKPIETAEDPRRLRLALEESVKTAQSLRDVHLKLFELEIDLQKHTTFRGIIVKNLLLVEKFDLAVEALFDHKLNIPGAKLFGKCLQYCKTHDVPETSQMRLLHAIQNGLELGMISAKEIGHLVQTLFSMKEHRSFVLSTNNLLDYYEQMWLNMQACKVFTGKDLGIEKIDSWLAKLNELPFSERTMSLAMSMIRNAPPTKETDYQNLTVFLKNWVNHRLGSVSGPLSIRRTEISGVADLLSIMPPDYAWAFVSKTIPFLPLERRKDELGHPVIGAWMTTVSDVEFIGQRLDFEDATLDVPFSSKGPRHCRKSSGRKPVSDSNLTSTRFIQLHRYWTQNLRIPRLEQPLSLPSITSSLLAHIQSHPDTSARARCARNLMLSLHDFRLPYLWLWEPIQSLWFSDPQTCPPLTAFAKSLSPYGLSLPLIPPAEQFKSFQTTQPEVALSLIPNLPPSQQSLHSHPTLTSTLIRRNTIAAYEFLKLSTPLSFRNALPFAHNLSPHDKTSSPYLALQHLHRLALEFAFSPHLSNRDAFRKVWALYTLARKNGAPLMKEMSRAVAHAGVGRWRVRGTGLGRPCDTQMMVVAGVVEAIEGKEAKMKLLFDGV